MQTPYDAMRKLMEELLLDCQKAKDHYDFHRRWNKERKLLFERNEWDESVFYKAHMAAIRTKNRIAHELEELGILEQSESVAPAAIIDGEKKEENEQG